MRLYGLPSRSHLTAHFRLIRLALLNERSQKAHGHHKTRSIADVQFFASSLTWSRALGISLYLNEADQDWYQRYKDIITEDQVVWWRDERELGAGVRVIECGGYVYRYTSPHGIQS